MKKFLIVSAISMMVAAPAFAAETGEKKDVPCTSVSSTQNGNQGQVTQSGDQQAAPAGNAGSAKSDSKDKK